MSAKQRDHGSSETAAVVGNLIERLLGLYKPEGVGIWLTSRHTELRGRRPYEVIAQGGFAEVDAIVHRLETGAFS